MPAQAPRTAAAAADNKAVQWAVRERAAVGEVVGVGKIAAVGERAAAAVGAKQAVVSRTVNGLLVRVQGGVT